MTNTIQTLSEHACLGGVQRFDLHDSQVIGLPMLFSLFRPPAALAHDAGKVPDLMSLIGLRCNEETFATKAGTHRRAAELGPDSTKWTAHDASALMSKCSCATYPDGILIDQGLADKFLSAQLHPEHFEAACENVAQPLQLRRHAGYDHGYYFISTFINDHLEHHARALSRT